MLESNDDDLHSVLATLVHDLRNLRTALMLELASARQAVAASGGGCAASLENILENLDRVPRHCASLEDLAEHARGLLSPGASAGRGSRSGPRGSEDGEVRRVVEEARGVLVDCAGRLAAEPTSEEVSLSQAVRLLGCVRELEGIASALVRERPCRRCAVS